MNATPRKLEGDQIFRTLQLHTPEQVCLSSLSEQLSTLKIKTCDDEEFSFKRSADLLTVEGSPIMQNVSKRLDSNPTPVRTMQNICDVGDEKSTGKCISPLLSSFSDIIVSKTPQEFLSDTETKNMSPDQQQQHHRKVLVIHSGSNNDHQTGLHQENARRTDLLCGSDGCLRRNLPVLKSHVELKSGAAIPCVPLSDLLRCC